MPPLEFSPDAMMVIVIVLAAAAIPMGKWAAGSWTTAALVGAGVNVFWSYEILDDPAAAPWVSFFLVVPYLAFTVAGCIGWFRDRRPRRLIGVVVPPALYALPYVVVNVVNELRFER